MITVHIVNSEQSSALIEHSDVKPPFVPVSKYSDMTEEQCRECFIKTMRPLPAGGVWPIWDEEYARMAWERDEVDDARFLQYAKEVRSIYGENRGKLLFEESRHYYRRLPQVAW